jgi:cell division protein FtsB
MNYWVVIYRFAWLTLVILLAIGLTCVFVPKCNQLRQLQKRKAAIERENRETETRTRELRERQERFRNDPAFVERVAHDMGLVRENEVVFKFTNTNTQAREP